jgi:hypothetical protein
MIADNTNVTAEDQAFVQEQFLPAIEDLTQRFVTKATSVAESEGWLPDHAKAAAALGTAPFLEALLSDVPPADAVESAITRGKQLALGEMFKTEIEGGADRHAAFRAILGLQLENGVRAGEASGEVPAAWMDAALAEVDAAAAADRTPEDQVMAGLRSIMAAALDNAAAALRAEH